MQAISLICKFKLKKRRNRKKNTASDDNSEASRLRCRTINTEEPRSLYYFTQSRLNTEGKAYKHFTSAQSLSSETTEQVRTWNSATDPLKTSLSLNKQLTTCKHLKIHQSDSTQIRDNCEVPRLVQNDRSRSTIGTIERRPTKIGRRG